MSDQERQAHDELERAYFDERVEFFKRPIPDEIQNRTRLIIKAARLSEQSRVLDVATGVGVLIEHICAEGVPDKNITACDLSSRMLEEACLRYPGVDFLQVDFLDLPESPGNFDAIFFNACFGNFLDQEKVIDKAAKLLAPGGRIVIGHPMGSRFVLALHTNEPEIVPHLLPGRQTLLTWQSKFGLALEELRDETVLYIAVLKHSAENE